MIQIILRKNLKEEFNFAPTTFVFAYKIFRCVCTAWYGTLRIPDSVNILSDMTNQVIQQSSI